MMANPFDIQDAAYARHARLLQEAERSRMLRPVRKQRARRRREAVALLFGSLLSGRSGSREPSGRPTAAE